MRCSRCILPENIPGIKYDNNGVCNYCRKYEKDFSNWDAIKQQKKEEFEKLLTQAKRLNRTYDCLIPLSGGKDSTYTLYLCSKVYGLKCLAVTFDNGFLTDRAKINIENALKETNVDHTYYHINKSNSLALYKSFLIKTGKFCDACMRSINFSIETAVKMFNVPLIIKGSGRRVQYVSQISEISGSNSPSFFKSVIKGEPIEKDFRQLFSDIRTLETHLMFGALCDIINFPRTKIMRFIPQYVGIYDYIYKPYPKIIEILKTEMGWGKLGDTIEHLDCALHGIPFYIQTLRIPKITTETLYNSGLIRQGLITRDEAMEIENEKINNPNTPIELEFFLKEISMEYDDFVNYVKLGNPAQYEPKMGKILMEVYHKKRKW
ncbi:MAG: hypothetical protein K8R25_00950 [Methanosarcinales archaeon]|nr:hypothetical protein [Methanosarcinales archaeon]